MAPGKEVDGEGLDLSSANAIIHQQQNQIQALLQQQQQLQLQAQASTLLAPTGNILAPTMQVRVVHGRVCLVSLFPRAVYASCNDFSTTTTTAWRCVCVCVLQTLLTQQTLAQQTGSLSQVEALASLLQQAQQLQEVQTQMTMGGAVGGGTGGAMSGGLGGGIGRGIGGEMGGDGGVVLHMETPEPQTVFNTVRQLLL